MSWDRDFGFDCEYCGDTIGGGLEDFEESQSLMKSSGWINRKVDGEWCNFCCQDCYDAYIHGDSDDR